MGIGSASQATTETVLSKLAYFGTTAGREKASPRERCSGDVASSCSMWRGEKNKPGSKS